MNVKLTMEVVITPVLILLLEAIHVPVILATHLILIIEDAHVKIFKL